MAKSFFHGFIVLTVILAGLSPALAGKNGPPDGAKVAPLPEAKPGSQWTLRYANGAETTLAISQAKNGKLFFSNGTVFTAERNMLEGYGPRTGDPISYSPHLRTYSFPLWEGKTWGGWVTWTSGQYSGSYRVNVKAAAWETITVPAGTFEAMRLETLGNGKPWSTCWYAALAEFPAKCTFHQHGADFELLAYKLVK